MEPKNYLSIPKVYITMIIDAQQHPLHRRSGRGWEARRVCAVEGDVSAPAASQDSQSASRYSQGASRQFARGGRRVRCFNCGDVTRHMAADCPRPRLPKRCHYCKVMLYTSSEVAIPNLSDHLRDNSHGKCPNLVYFYTSRYWPDMT